MKKGKIRKREDNVEEKRNIFMAMTFYDKKAD